MSDTPYISWLCHGAVSLAPPAVFTGAKANLFAIDASTAAIQSLADALLNPAAGTVVHYEAVAPVAIFTFMDIAKCTSATDVVGWLPGRECAIWVPLIEIHPGFPFRKRVVFWAPYIFIDYTIGMVTGREVWGWPKVASRIVVASDTPGKPVFSCTTTFFRTMKSDTQGEHAELYRIAQVEVATESFPQWLDGENATQALIGGLLDRLSADVLGTLGRCPQIPSVVLKQFRAADAPQSACFQAIVDSPVEVTAFNGGGPLLDKFTLDITTCESHGIVSDLLGRPPDRCSTTLPVRFAAWLALDFRALLGNNIASARLEF